MNWLKLFSICFKIEQILKDEKKILKDKTHHYAEGYEDLIKKNDTFKAERMKFEKTVMVLKERNISQMKQLIELQKKNYDSKVELKTLNMSLRKINKS